MVASLVAVDAYFRCLLHRCDSVAARAGACTATKKIGAQREKAGKSPNTIEQTLHASLHSALLPFVLLCAGQAQAPAYDPNRGYQVGPFPPPNRFGGGKAERNCFPLPIDVAVAAAASGAEDWLSRLPPRAVLKEVSRL